MGEFTNVLQGRPTFYKAAAFLQLKRAKICRGRLMTLIENGAATFGKLTGSNSVNSGRSGSTLGFPACACSSENGPRRGHASLPSGHPADLALHPPDSGWENAI